MFPRIESIDDVLPHIGGNIGFFVSRFDAYDVIDYGFVGDDTFRSPMALECRGLKFAKDGRLIARPFHKFFNLGERQRPEEIDWHAPHVVLPKLDGSMVHPCMLDGEIVFMTRMGATHQAAVAASHADDDVRALARHTLDAGMTALLEFTAPDNRIVIAYDRPQLTLLAVRDNLTGDYLPDAALRALAARFGVAVAEPMDTGGSPASFAVAARNHEGVEGYVVAFDDGHRLKLKTGYYALRHKALSGMAFEKNVLAWVAENAVDDILPLVADDIGDSLRGYRSTVAAGVERLVGNVAAFVAAHESLDRRTFAEAVRSGLDKRLQPVAFAMLDGKDARDLLRRQLAWASLSETRLETIRDLYGMSWKSPGLPPEAG